MRETHALRPIHVEGATLFSDRFNALKALNRGGHVAEIGVALGTFSEAIMDTLSPAHFDAFDIFRMHEMGSFWGQPTSQLLSGLTHRQFYERRFSDSIESGRMSVYEGDGASMLSLMPDNTYDVIYIDARHSFEYVLKDAEVSAQKLKIDGVLVFNDYIMYDHLAGHEYGVVAVVNDFCVNRGWRVFYFALQPQMFCDIAICRRE